MKICVYVTITLDILPTCFQIRSWWFPKCVSNSSIWYCITYKVYWKYYGLHYIWFIIQMYVLLIYVVTMAIWWYTANIMCISLTVILQCYTNSGISLLLSVTMYMYFQGITICHVFNLHLITEWTLVFFSYYNYSIIDPL